VKLVEVRRSELVDAAQALFFAKGYDATTVADIIAEAGVSKGGFYHHFESKEELLDAMIERLTALVIDNARDVLEDPDLDALTKLNRFFAKSLDWKAQAAPAMRGIFLLVLKPENAPLYQRLVRAGVAVLSPALTRIVEQGIEEGIFDVPDPGIVVEIFLHLSNNRFAIAAEAVARATRGDVDGAVATFEKRIRSEEAMINRILGLPRGTIRFGNSAQLRMMLAAVA
jgi:AcrR family transcriptional regulator